MTGVDPCPDEDTVALYALGALTPPEIARVHEHMRACLSCTTRLAQARSVADALLLSAPDVEPPPALAASILRRARPARSGRLRWWLAVAAAVLLAANGWQAWRLVTGGRALARVEAQRDQAWQEGRLAVQLLGRGARRIHLVGTPVARDASAVVRIVRRGDSRVLLLTATGLPALHASQVYHLWLVHHGRRMSGGTFTVGAHGHGALAVKIPAGTVFNALGVTREPSARTREPLGPKVLGATVSG